MTGNKAVNSNQGTTNAAGPYTIYSAGGLFTQDELATNVMLKEAVWRLSNGKFQIFLPQSREIREDEIALIKQLKTGFIDLVESSDKSTSVHRLQQIPFQQNRYSFLFHNKLLLTQIFY